MLKLALSRKRAPMGGRFGLVAVPASWRAGQRYDVSVVSAVIRMAWVIDAGLHLVVADESGQDREAGRVGRRPAGRAQGVRVEVPDRARAGGGTRGVVLRVVELVERAGGRVDHDGVAVAGGLLAALDGRARTERVGPRVALVGVVEGDGDAGCDGDTTVYGMP